MLSLKIMFVKNQISAKWRLAIILFIAYVFVLMIFESYQYYFYSTKFVLTNFSPDNAVYFGTNSSDYDKLMKKEFRLMNFFDNISQDGTPFNKKWNAYLRQLNLLDVQNFDDIEVLQSEPIIGTAISSNHFLESLRFFESLINSYEEPRKKMVYVYDLGLRIRERNMLIGGYGDIIKEFRDFPFNIYPTYVTKLRGFRWKAIVVADLLKEFPSIWWMDTSVMIKKPLSAYYPDIRLCATNISSCQRYPWNLLWPTSHGIWAYTDEQMYDYLPFPDDKGKQLTMYAATAQLIFATKHVREHVLRYWVLCALEEECMDPTNSTIICSHGSNRYTISAGCNRQDQSAINILLARVNNFNVTKYYRGDIDGTITYDNG